MTRRRAHRWIATAAALLVAVTALTAAPASEAEATRYCENRQRPVRDAVERISGPDRYATAVAISKAHFPADVCTVYIASGLDYPDALGGAAVASGPALVKPVLLVAPTGIPAIVRTELQRLNPWEIVVLGGTAAVSPQVFDQLSALAEGYAMRMGGSDRYATTAEIYHGTGTKDRVYIASGQSFPDALTGAALAGRAYMPLLLTARDGIPASVRTRLAALRPKQIIVLGGTGAVSASVESALRGYASTGSVSRIGGADRYATAVEISKQVAPYGSQTVYIASGAKYPDALSAAPASTLPGAPVLLVAPTAIPAVVDEELRRLQPRHIVILGGTGAVSADVATQLDAYRVP